MHGYKAPSSTQTGRVHSCNYHSIFSESVTDFVQLILY